MSAGKKTKKEAVGEMNDLARRIWRGQSVSLPLIERVGRIKAALIHHGYEAHTKDLVLPVKGLKKYL